MEYSKLYTSIEQLNESTIPNWGKMNSSMMLKHCRRFIDMYLNKTKSNVLYSFFGLIFGIFHRLLLKHIVRYNVRNYIRNLPTLKFFNTYRHKDLDFELERIKLLKALKEVESIEKKYIYNSFHGIVSNKYFKKVVYFHTSYHLYQFGVYDS